MRTDSKYLFATLNSIQVHTADDIEDVASKIPGTLSPLTGARKIHQLDIKPDGSCTAKLMPMDETSFPVRVRVTKKGVAAGN